MSSDHSMPVQIQGGARLHGTQHAARTPAPSGNQPPKGSSEDHGKGSAASGENLPLNRVDQAAERKRTEQVESAVSRISDFVQNFQRDLVFSIDKDSDRLVVKVVDSATKQVIRQIPEEETLSIAKHLDSSESLIIRKQA